MPYITRPYVRYTLICPSPFLEYEVTQDKLYIHHNFFGIFRLGQSASYTLQGADIEPVQNWLQHTLGIGGLSIKTSNSKVTCERLATFNSSGLH